MSYNSTTGIVTRGTAGITIKKDGDGDIQKALGDANVKDVITACTHANINEFSRYKPNAVDGDESPNIENTALCIANRYFLSAKATRTRASLPTMDFSWTYHGANGPYRVLDYAGYCNKRVIPFRQANGTSLSIDPVAGTADTALFYMFFRSGHTSMKNRPFSTTEGIASSGYAVGSSSSATQLNNLITIEDLSFDEGQGTFHTLFDTGTVARLGLVIFNTNNVYQTEKWATTPVKIPTARENDMFKVQLSDVSLPTGTYKAVACAMIEDGNLSPVYCPVFNDVADTLKYSSLLELVVIGINGYSQRRVGISVSQATSTTTTITTTSADVYVTMQFYNKKSSGSITIATGTNAKFQLKTEFSGMVDINGVQTPIDRTVANGKAHVTSTLLNSSNITIAAGGNAALLYNVSNIWSVDGTSASQARGGSVTIKSSIYFNGGEEFGVEVGHAVLTVNYGV